MLRKIGLVFAAWVIGMVMIMTITPSWAADTKQEQPASLEAMVCGTLVDHFAYIYELHSMGVEQALVEEIVARDPDLDMWQQYPLYVATVLLYQMTEKIDPTTWMFATQLGCVRILGLDFLEPRGKFRFFYKDLRKEISFK